MHWPNLPDWFWVNPNFHPTRLWQATAFHACVQAGGGPANGCRSRLVPIFVPEWWK